MPSRRSVIAGLVGMASAFATAGAGAEPTTPDAKAFIERLGVRAVEALTGPDLPQEVREERFRAMLAENFDLPTIGKIVLGRYWRTATDAERQEFLRLFEDFIVKSYAVRFSEYSGEQFRVYSVRKETANYTIVHSTVLRPNAEDVRVDWRLQEDGDFKIVDIMVEGVSMVVTQRAEFASVIQSSGGKVGGLNDVLRKKVGQRRQQSATQ